MSPKIQAKNCGWTKFGENGKEWNQTVKDVQWFLIPIQENILMNQAKRSFHVRQNFRVSNELQPN